MRLMVPWKSNRRTVLWERKFTVIPNLFFVVLRWNRKALVGLRTYNDIDGLYHRARALRIVTLKNKSSS